MKTLARLQIPKSSLQDIYNKAEDYGKKLEIQLNLLEEQV